ncbi:MAG: hypothetical protein LJF15_06265 [Acidobacteria bacterium]|nr:hypothetical protein [Acidobacteriota bacterium]
MRRTGSSTLKGVALAAAVVAAFGAWVVAGHRILNAPSVSLSQSERSVFSPGGQDGVLERVFEVVEPTHRYLVDLGAGDGVRGSFSRNLIANHGWRGVLVESDPELGAALRETYAGQGAVRTLQAGIYPGDIEIQLERADVPPDLDLLIVTLHANDWHVWRAIQEFRPKVVQIEYNAAFVPPQTMVIDYHPLNYWDGSLYFGASIQSLFALGQKKGYELVYADRSGTSLYFVDRRYYPRFGLADNDPATLFVPRAGFPLIKPSTLWRYVRPDGRPWEEAESELVRKDVRIRRTFVVGEL